MLLLISSCGVTDGNGVLGLTTQLSYLYVANYGSSTLSMFQLQNGTLSRAATSIATGSGTSNPNDMTSRSDLPFVFAAHTISGNLSVYNVSNYSATYPGALSTLSPTFAFSSGAGAASVALHPTLAYVYSANSNLGGSNISIKSIEPSTGVLTPVNARAAGANPSWIVIDPTGQFLYVANFGSNNVTAFSINSGTGDLTVINTYISGTGPRVLAMDVLGRYLYALNETAGTLSGWTINSGTGALTATAPATFVVGGTGPVRLATEPSGKYLFAANTTSNNISVLSINATSGNLSAVPGSPFSYNTSTQPFGLAVDPLSGTHLAVAFAGEQTLGIFNIDLATGSLTATTESLSVGANPRTVLFKLQSGLQ